MSNIREYQTAVDVIKTAILQSQARATKAINQEQLALYFGIGRYVSENTRKKYWGQGAIETISNQLRKELPGLRGFSATSMRNMRTFYEEWKQLESNSSVATDEIKAIHTNSSVVTDEFTVSSDNSAVTTAKFANGKAFVTTDEIRRIDLLFFNRDLNRTVVFELKNGNFKVAYLAQLSAYLRILNDDDRRDHEEAPIGIILCKNADKNYAGYIMQDFLQPMGVATYKTADEIDPELLKALPPREELQRVFEESGKKEEE